MEHGDASSKALTTLFSFVYMLQHLGVPFRDVEILPAVGGAKL